RLEASLALEADQRRTGPGVEHAGNASTEEAFPDQNRLNLADLRLAQVHRHDRACRRAAQVATAAERHHVNDPVAAVQEYDLVLHDEEAVVAVTREGIDQDWERRHGDDTHVSRDDRTGSDRETYAIKTRRIACRQDGLLD